MAATNKISIAIELVNTNIKTGLEQLKKLLNELRGAGAGAGDDAANDASRNLDRIRDAAKRAKEELDRLRGAGGNPPPPSGGNPPPPPPRPPSGNPPPPIPPSGSGSDASLRAAAAQADNTTSAITRAKAALIGFAGTVVSFVFVKNLINTADKWLQLTNTVKNATDSVADYEQAMTAVIAISRKTYTSLDANAVLFAKINRALKDMGGTTSQSIFLTDMVAKLAGMETNAAGAAAGVYQLTQAIASGKFAGDEFRSVSEQLPIFASTLAKGLGKSLGQLREMSQAGQLGTAEIMQGLGNQAKEVDEIFKNMPVTFSKATQNMENKWLELVGTFNASNGITQALGQGINFLADNLQVFGEYLLKVMSIGFVAGLAKLSSSLIATAQASRIATLEAKANAVANAQAQAAEEARLVALAATVAAREAEIQATIVSTEATIAATQADIRSTQAMLASAATMQTRAALVQRITILNSELAASQALLIEQQAALNVVQTEGNLTAASLASTTTILSAGIAGLVGWEVGSWARESSVWVEKLGVALAGLVNTIINPEDWLTNPKEYAQAWIDQFNAVGEESIKERELREANEKHAAEVAKQGEDLKTAAIQEGIKKSKDALERLNDARKTIYERDLRELEQAEQQKLAALNTVIPARLQVEESYQSEKLTIAKAGGISELELLKQKTAIEIDSNNQRLQASQAFNQQKLADVEAIYGAEIQSAKKRGLDITGLEREANNEKKSIILDSEKAYEASIARLNAIDADHRNKAIGYLNEINAQEQNRLNQLRGLDAQGLNNAQQTEQRKKQIAQDTAQVKKLIADGEYAKAAELGKKLQDLTYQQAQATRTAAAEQNKLRAGTGDDNAALQARNQYNQSVDLTTKALQAAADAETKQADTAKLEADKQKTALEQVRSTIADIDAAISKANTLKVNVDQASLNASEQAINNVARDRTATVNVKTVESHANGGLVGGYSSGGQVSGSGTKTSDSIPAMLSNGEYVIRTDSVNSVGVNALHYINTKGQLPKFSAGGLVNGLTPSFNPVVSGQQSQKSGDTFVLQIPFGNATGTFTGQKTAENTDFLEQIASAMKSQKRGMAS